MADATGGYRWEGDVDATGQVSEVSIGQPDPVEWQTYNNADYGFSFRFPSTGTLAENPAELGVPGGRAPRSIVLTRDTLRLLVQYKGADEEAVLGPGGRGAGDIVDQGTVSFFGDVAGIHRDLERAMGE